MIGFEEVEKNLTKLYQNEKLHHAILLCGQRGIGKASFIKNFTKNLGDVLLIEKEKKDILVDQIRKITGFVNQTSSSSRAKFIIIDSADDLNKSSSNAILKILEEPQKDNYFFLISHNTSKLLATIKSRCILIKIKNLCYDQFKEILIKKKPHFKDDEIKILSEICNNSISSAYNDGEVLLDVYNLFLSSKINDGTLKKISEINFEISANVIEFLLKRFCDFLNKFQLERFSASEKKFFSSKKISLEKFFEISSTSRQILHQTTHLNLDKKLAIINIFNSL
jgi:DNA polymerase-3 subunit delta'